MNDNINKNQWIYQWICGIQIIWKLSYVNLLTVIVFEFFEHWEAVVQSCSVVKVFVEISQNSQENTCARASILINLQAWGLQLY